MTTAAAPSTPQPSKGLNAALFIVQFLLGITFAGTGVWKLITPIPELQAMIPWTGQVSPAFLYAIAVIDLLGGIGVVLPSITRIKPGVTVLAALGCALLQVCAIIFHLSRGEAANTLFNFVLVGLSVFVAWGRWMKVPIADRSDG